MSSKLVEPWALMRHALRQPPRPGSLAGSPRADDDPFSEATELRAHAANFLRTWRFGSLFLECVSSRMYVDRVHYRAVFEMKGVVEWVAEYRNAVKELLERKDEALEHLRFMDGGKNLESGKRYLASIKYRLHLCEQLAEGHGISTALQSWQKQEHDEDVEDLATLAGADALAVTAPWPQAPPEAIASGEVHVYWEYARFVKHKMMFMIVELRHEAGPFFTSTEDHLALAHKAWAYTGYFHEVARAATSPLTAQSTFGIRVGDDCAKIRDKLNHVVNHLIGYRQEHSDQTGPTGVTDAEVKKELEKVAKTCLEIWKMAAEVEQALRKHVTGELQRTWRRAFGDVVLTEVPALPGTLFEIDALLKVVTNKSDAALTAALPATLDDLSSLKSAGLIEDWLVAVLERGLELPEEGLNTELMALELFRRLLQVEPGASAALHWRILSEDWLEPRLRSSAALMLTGALVAAAGNEVVAGVWKRIDWKDRALCMLSGTVASGLAEDHRIALAAGLFVTGVICLPENYTIAKQIGKDFCELREATPEKRRAFFAQHFADLLKPHTAQPEKHFLKLVALGGALDPKHLLWPEDTPAIAVMKQEREQFNSFLRPIRALAEAM